MAFNRAARALQEVLQRFLMLPVVNYFDDFPHVDVEGMAVRSQVVMEEAMRTLVPRNSRSELLPHRVLSSSGW